MSTLRHNKNLTGVAVEGQEEHPGNSHSRNTVIPRTKDDFICTQLSEKIGDRKKKKFGLRSEGQRCKL